MRPISKALRPKFTPAKLFAAGAQGAWYDPSSLWGAADHLPRRNLLTYSEDFSNAAWTKTGITATSAGITPPDNITTAWKVTHAAASGEIYGPSSLSCVSGVRYTASAYVKYFDTPWVRFTLAFGSTAIASGWVNVQTGTLGANTTTTGTATSASQFIETIGGGWYRVTISATCGTTVTNGYVQINTASGDASSTRVAASYLSTGVMFAPSSTTDQSYQKITDWTTELYAHAASKNVPWLRRNRFLNTATLSTQTVSSVTATPLTVSFKGTGTITFSTAYVGSLVGTGASDRVSLTFTPGAGNLVCTVTGTVTEAQCEVAGTATTYQPIGASWEAQYAANAAAAGVPLTLYQDSAGTTPVTGPDSVVGFLGDLAQGYALGSELVTNGTFDSNITGWTTTGSATASWSSGSARLTATGAAQFSRSYDFIGGKTYLISGIATLVSGTLNCTFTVRTTNAYDTSSYIAGFSFVSGETVKYLYTPASNITAYISARPVSGTQTVDIDNISVRELPGYHAIQSGATGLKPTLRLSPNGYWYIQRDLSDDALITTFPNLGTACASYINDGATVTETTGLTLNGALTQSTPAADYGRIYLNAPSAKAAQITKWLKAKAGLA